uniref:Uncharacterized protein n=1 Tax=Solanum lycopersicum TaxID=4081 RepID=A0A3Q7I469_SOLLC
MDNHVESLRVKSLLMMSGSCKKRVLNFFQTRDHKNWKIEKLLTSTLDNATTNDASITHLKGRISD